MIESYILIRMHRITFSALGKQMPSCLQQCFKTLEICSCRRRLVEQFQIRRHSRNGTAPEMTVQATKQKMKKIITCFIELDSWLCFQFSFNPHEVSFALFNNLCLTSLVLCRVNTAVLQMNQLSREKIGLRLYFKITCIQLILPSKVVRPLCLHFYKYHH